MARPGRAECGRPGGCVRRRANGGDAYGTCPSGSRPDIAGVPDGMQRVRCITCKLAAVEFPFRAPSFSATPRSGAARNAGRASRARSAARIVSEGPLAAGVVNSALDRSVGAWL